MTKYWRNVHWWDENNKQMVQAIWTSSEMRFRCRCGEELATDIAFKEFTCQCGKEYKLELNLKIKE